MTEAGVMWRPLRQQIPDLACKTLPESLKKRPVTTSAVVAVILPWFFLIMFTLPFILLADHGLQSFYNRHSKTIDSVVVDLLELVKLFYDACRISCKHTFRVVKRVARRALQEPLWLAQAALGWIWFCIINPFKVARIVLGFMWRAGQGVVRAAVMVKNTVKPADDDW